MNIELSIVVNNHGVGLGEIHAATQKVVKMDKTCKLMLNHAFMIVHVAIYTSLISVFSPFTNTVVLKRKKSL